MIVYHCTAGKNLLAIKRWGLIPRDTTEHNYPGMRGINHGIEAVYVCKRPWYWGGPHSYDGRAVCLELDVTDLPVEPDPLTSGERVLARITPERIKRVLRTYEDAEIDPPHLAAF